MRVIPAVLASIALCFFGLQNAVGQVLWRMDFESAPIGLNTGYSSVSSAEGVQLSAQVAVADAGTNHGHAIQLSVDSSVADGSWSVEWDQPLTAPWATTSTADSYAPARTFLRFDAWASSGRPIHIKLYYNSQTSMSDTRNLEIDVTPAVVDSFQTFVVPLCSFSTTWLTGNPPDAPTSMSFAMKGDPTNSASTWPCASNNVIMLDNIAYTIAPPLTISARHDGTVISWPTNSAGFTLQENSGVCRSIWTNLTANPSVAGGEYQLVVSPASDNRFYRLMGP